MKNYLYCPQSVLVIREEVGEAFRLFHHEANDDQLMWKFTEQD